MKISNLLLISILCMTLSRCASLGSKTLYKSQANVDIKRIGFTRLENDTVLNKTYSKTTEIFEKGIIETVNKYKLENVISIDETLSINKTDSVRIARICQENNLDGLIIPVLTFIHVTHTVGFIPIAKNYDTKVFLKLYDKEGKLILTVSHDTLKGNSYMMPPPASKTVYDGAAGAINKMAKEYNWTK